MIFLWLCREAASYLTLSCTLAQCPLKLQFCQTAFVFVDICKWQQKEYNSLWQRRGMYLMLDWVKKIRNCSITCRSKTFDLLQCPSALHREQGGVCRVEGRAESRPADQFWQIRAQALVCDVWRRHVVNHLAPLFDPLEWERGRVGLGVGCVGGGWERTACTAICSSMEGITAT